MSSSTCRITILNELERWNKPFHSRCHLRMPYDDKQDRVITSKPNNRRGKVSGRIITTMNTIFMLAFVLPIVLGTVILATGSALLIWNSRHSKRDGQVEADDWPMAGGKILAAHLGEHETRHSDSHGTHVDITYEPVVEYVYTIDNAEYHGSKVFPGGDSDFGQAEAQEIIDRYPLNSYAPVRYDPENPEEFLTGGAFSSRHAPPSRSRPNLDCAGDRRLLFYLLYDVHPDRQDYDRHRHMKQTAAVGKLRRFVVKCCNLRWINCPACRR